MKLHSEGTVLKRYLLIIFVTLVLCLVVTTVNGVLQFVCQTKCFEFLMQLKTSIVSYMFKYVFKQNQLLLYCRLTLSNAG